METISDLIPRLPELRKQTNKPVIHAAVTDEHRKKVIDLLAEAGFDAVNRGVYDTLVTYGSREIAYANTKGLFLTGPAGIGKTLGVSVLAAKFGWPVIPVADVISTFLSATETEFQDFISAMDFWGLPRVVVLDDLGVEPVPVNRFGTAFNVLADVLDVRYRLFLRYGVRTIVTTNLGDAELVKRYGFRMDDRLNQMFNFAAVTGISRRK